MHRVVALLLGGMALCLAAACTEPEPGSWFDQLEFGMSSSTAGAILRDMKPAEGGEQGQSPASAFSRYVAPDLEFDGLRGCEAELRFFEDRLWVTVVNYGDNLTEEAERVLRERYGDPTQDGGTSTYWRGGEVEVILQRNQRWFSFADEAISAEVRKTLFEAPGGLQKKER